MRQKLVVGNWKMNGSSQQIESLAGEMLSGLANLANPVEIGLCPAYVYLPLLGELLSDSAVLLGAQNASQYEAGAYTGEVACSMLRDLGGDAVIVGHSERRQLFGESSEAVAAKFEAVTAGGMMPILCVGETLEQREQGATEAVVLEQLATVWHRVGAAGFANAVVAYEPVWAIGTGKTASPDQAQAVHKLLREFLAQQDEQTAVNTRIIYGGSVKSSNAKELFDQADIDGGLVGGASLDAKEFIAICASADT